MSHHGTHFAVGTSASYSLLKSASGYSHVPGFVFLLAPLDAVKSVCVLVSGSGHSPELTSLRPLFSLIALFARSARFFSRGAREEVDASFFGAPEKKSTLRSLRSLLFSRRQGRSQHFARFFSRSARVQVNASLAPLASFFGAPEKKSTLRSLRSLLFSRRQRRSQRSAHPVYVASRYFQ